MTRKSLTARQWTVLAAAADMTGAIQTAHCTTKGVRTGTMRLTPAGREALGAGDAAARKADEAILAALPADRRAPFVEALGKVSEAVSVPVRGSRRPRSAR
jgi:hypothetical protein